MSRHEATIAPRPTTWVGIDPGITGSLVALDESGALVMAERTPLIRGTPDVAAAAAIFDRLKARGPLFVVCEKPFPNKRGGKIDTGYLSLLASVKFWESAAGPRVKFLKVPPVTWQRLVAGVAGVGKAKAIGWCRVFLPSLDLYPGRCEQPCDALSDAAVMAEYGRRLALATARTVNAVNACSGPRPSRATSPPSARTGRGTSDGHCILETLAPRSLAPRSLALAST